jgi:membrane protease YdiL (CAAX protease family)
MAVHGGLPLAAVGMWELWVRRRARGDARGGVVAFVGTLAGVALLLAPLVARFSTAGAAAMATSPGTWIVLPDLCGTVLLLAALRDLGARLADWGIGLGDWRWWLPHHGVLLGLLVPVLVATTWLVPPLAAFYPVYKPARTHLDALVLAHGALALDFIGWEFLFRGFLLFAVARRGDALLAILVQALPFFLLHSPKPEIEMLSSFVGGIFAGWFCLRARSFFPLYVIHLTMITTVGCASFALRAMG